MKKWMVLPLMFMALMLIAASCHGVHDGPLAWGNAIKGSGTTAKETRSFRGLRGVHLATFGELRVQVGEKDELTIEMDDNLIEFIQTEVTDGVLHIGFEPDASVRTKSKVRYSLTVSSLELLRASSSGDIIARDMIGDGLEIDLSSSGDATVNLVDGQHIELSTSSSGDIRIVTLNGKKLQASLSSSGDVSIKDGEVDSQEVSLSSSGDYDAPSLKSRQATVKTRSSGDARIWVTEKLRAASSSSGSVQYRGDPQVEARESSSGDIERISG